MSRRAGGALVVAGLVVVAGLGGCVDRRIFITSDPSGARVYLNDQDVGVTPLEVNFTWFGVYDVRVRKEGYEPLVTTREAKAPLHEVPPFDLFALAVPGTKTTHVDWHFDLEPARSDTSGLLARADELRARLEADERREELEAGPEAEAGARKEPADGSSTGDVREIEPVGQEHGPAPEGEREVREVEPEPVDGSGETREAPTSNSDVREIIPATPPQPVHEPYECAPS